MNAIVLACSGPSLDPTQVLESEHQVVVISTAIRSLYNVASRLPEFWAFIDPINKNHGTQGVQAAQDDRIVKVIPHKFHVNDEGDRLHGRKLHKTGIELPITDQVTRFEYQRLETNTQTMWKTVCFASVWAVSIGYDTLIYAGCDLARPNEWSYGIRDDEPQSVALEAQRTHQQEKTLAGLQSFHENNPDIRMISWTPDSRINEFMETQL